MMATIPKYSAGLYLNPHGTILKLDRLPTWQTLQPLSY